MKKTFLITLFLTIILFSACSNTESPDARINILTQIENATPIEYNKQYEMETFLLFTAKDKNGHSMEYYVVVTTYHAATPISGIELHKDALSTVFDVDRATCIRQFDSHGHPAAIYSLGDHNFACCTTAPDTSVVMQYLPDAISEEEAMKTIQSIFKYQDFP